MGGIYQLDEQGEQHRQKQRGMRGNLYLQDVREKETFLAYSIHHPRTFTGFPGSTQGQNPNTHDSWYLLSAYYLPGSVLFSNPHIHPRTR